MKAKVEYKKKARRIGRGVGSGRGKTSCRGHKGQKARTGYSRRWGFEGGQNPLYRRLPKRGFNNPFHKEYSVVNVAELNKCEGNEITPAILKAQGITRNIKLGVKVLGSGDLKKALTVTAHRFSDSAREKIEKAGGKAILIKMEPKEASASGKKKKAK